MLRIFGCQTMHNFVYLAIVHEPLVKHEKNLGCSACLFAELSSNRNTSMKNVITYMARNLYFVRLILFSFEMHFVTKIHLSA